MNEEIDWGRFSRLYRAGAVRIASGRVGDADHAEDLVQEALAATIKRARDGTHFESREHARNYFFRALNNLAVSSLRSARRETGPIDEEALALAAEPPEPDEDRRAIENAVGSLDEGERALLRMRYSEGRTFREIAEGTGTAISTLQARVESILGKIRTRIGKGARDA